MSDLHSLAEASDISAAPERLRALASHPRAEVRRAVAANPNTPEEVLLRLAVHFPEEFLANPVLDLLLLVNPNFMAEIPPYLRGRLLAHPNMPSGFLGWAARNGDEAALLSLAQNPNTPTALIELLTGHVLPKVAEAASLHVSLQASPLPQAVLFTGQEADTSELRGLALLGLIPQWLSGRLAREADSGLRTALAESQATPADTLSMLLFDEDEGVRQAARSNPNAPPESAEFLARLEAGQPLEIPLETLAKGHSWLCQLVARHPQAPSKVLEGFVTHEDWRVRQAVAANRNLAANGLNTLSADADRDVRQAVASNPASPVQALERLVGDENEEVRKAAAQNPSAPRHVLQLFERAQTQDAALAPEELDSLTRLSEWGKRLAVNHPNTPPETLERCHNDQDWHTRLGVAKNPKTLPSTLEALASDTDPDVRQAVAVHPSTPPFSLERLASDDQPDVRVQVAQNPAIPLSLLVKLAGDENWKVRQAVAANLGTPPQTLIGLAQDADRDVRQAVADNPNVPEQALEPLFSDWFAGLDFPMGLLELYRRATRLLPLPSGLLVKLACGNDWAKRLAARHPDTPSESLLLLAQDGDWRVRQAAACNPALGGELLVRLGHDSDADVRRAVLAHPRVPLEALQQLVLDDQNEVRQAVVRHPKVSEFILSVLLYDEAEEVRQAAIAHPLTPKELVVQYQRAEALDPSLDEGFLERLAGQTTWSRTLAGQNPSTPQATLYPLAQDADWRVRQAVAKNPATPVEVLLTLAADADRDVRQAVADNPNTVASTLLMLLKDSDEAIRVAALHNPSLTLENLAEYRADLLLRASRSRYPLNRAVALSQTELPQRELQKVKHWASPEWAVRYAVALNPNTSQKVLEHLAQDGNRLVREKALERIKDKG